ncbi:hypothetical protein AB0J42_05930 [Nonomuraea sp. NPDC049649]
MIRRIARVTITTGFLAALIALPAVADPDVDPCRNFHWTSTPGIQTLA